MDPISQQFTSASYAQYEKLHGAISSLAERITDVFFEKGTDWMKEQLKERAGYQDSLAGIYVFMPFIINNIVSLILENLELTEEEKMLCKNEGFIDQIRNDIFNESSLGDEWLAKFKQEA
jgi:hypothetical protein